MQKKTKGNLLFNYSPTIWPGRYQFRISKLGWPTTLKMSFLAIRQLNSI